MSGTTQAKLFLTGAPGTTDLLAEELRVLGIADAREVHGGVKGVAGQCGCGKDEGGCH